MEAMELEPLMYVETEGKKHLVFKTSKKRKVKTKTKEVTKVKKKKRVI